MVEFVYLQVFLERLDFFGGGRFFRKFFNVIWGFIEGVNGYLIVVGQSTIGVVRFFQTLNFFRRRFLIFCWVLFRRFRGQVGFFNSLVLTVVVRRWSECRIRCCSSSTSCIGSVWSSVASGVLSSRFCITVRRRRSFSIFVRAVLIVVFAVVTVRFGFGRGVGFVDRDEFDFYSFYSQVRCTGRAYISLCAFFCRYRIVIRFLMLTVIRRCSWRGC